jgi:hypothetical protein
MPKGEEKYCPRCNTAFECNAGSIHLCQCTTVTLNEYERDYMQLKYDDCLCADCMKEARAEYHNNKLRNKIKKLLGIFERE